VKRIRPSRDTVGLMVAKPYCGRDCDLDRGHRGPHMQVEGAGMSAQQDARIVDVTRTNDITGSITIYPFQGVRIAARIFWDSLIAVWRRDMVTLYFGHD
jgi:hypothetical protein